ncbi:MAG TPA: hypothetical protein VMQ81_12730, partial [Acidimicrobiia bacterium]|nr:hypothetical protein [Acidimicrobiia bacterium]
MGARTHVLHALKLAAAAADRLRPRRRGVTILLYHRVGGASGTEVDLPVSLFEQQVAELAASGRVVALDAALGALAAGAPPPGSDPGSDPVVVTF